MAKKKKHQGKIDKKKIKKSKVIFSSSISELDLHLLVEGKHYKSYEKLGARLKSHKKIKGVEFNVWAPNAKEISVAGEFNDWKPETHPMKKISGSGYWNVFIPGLIEGNLYKFAVKAKNGKTILKSDPYAFRCELRPGNASIVHSLKGYEWHDDEWIIKRKKSSLANPIFKKQPFSVYEVHSGSWKKDFSKNEWGYKNYKELAHELVDYVKEMNYTHIELLPLTEHPLDISWGYQTVNYFAPTSRYGSPEDLMYFVDYCHRNNIGVILDWVPSHFPTDEHGLGNFDGREIYAYENPLKGFHKDWGTYVFDYGKNEVRNFLISNALFWFEKYHIDALRVDAVASMLYLDYSRKEGEWEPNEFGGNENLDAVSFLKRLNETVHKKHKGAIMIAEESSAWPGVTAQVHLGGLGFDLKWNMGWMHDTLSYFSMDPVYRKYHHGKLTFSIWYAFSEKFLLPLSHDEVVHLKKSVIEKMPGDNWQKFANARLLYGFMFSHPGKKLNFMGNDIAQFREWNSESSLNWEVLENDLNKKFHYYFRVLGKLYSEHSAFHEVDFDSKGFQWIDFSDSDNSVIAFMRYNSDRTEKLLFTFNMTPVVRENYVFGVPDKGYYREILNSDAEDYGGSGIGNYGGVNSQNQNRYEFEYSVKVTLPPLAMNIYKFEPVIEIEESSASVNFKEKQTDDIIEEQSDVINKSEGESEIKEQIKLPEENTEQELVKKKIFKKVQDESEELNEDDMEKKIKEIVNRIKKF